MHSTNDNNVLARLIEKLSTEQYRTLRRYFDVFGLNSNTGKLIDFVRKNPVNTDFEVIRKELGLAKRAFAKLKYNTKIAALRAYRRLDFRPLGELKGLQAEVEIQIRKVPDASLFEWVEECKNLLIRSEQWENALLVCKHQKYLAKKVLLDEALFEMLERIDRQTDEFWQKISNLNKFQTLNTRYFQPSVGKQNMTGRVDMDLLEKLIKSPLLQSEKNADSILAKCEFYKMWEYYYSQKRNWKKANEAAIKQFRFCEENKWIGEEDAHEFSVLIRRIVGYNSVLENKKEAYNFCAILERFYNSNPDSKNEIWGSLILAKFQLVDNFSDKKSIGWLFREITSTEINLKNALSGSDYIWVSFITAQEMLKSGRTKEISRWLQNIISFENPFIQTHLQIYARVFHLAVCLSENDLIGLESHGRNYLRFIKKFDNVNYFLPEMITRFLKSIPDTNPERREKIFSLLKKEMGKTLLSKQGRYEFEAFCLENITNIIEKFLNENSKV